MTFSLCLCIKWSVLSRLIVGPASLLIVFVDLVLIYLVAMIVAIAKRTRQQLQFDQWNLFFIERSSNASFFFLQLLMLQFSSPPLFNPFLDLEISQLNLVLVSTCKLTPLGNGRLRFFKESNHPGF